LDLLVREKRDGRHYEEEPKKKKGGGRGKKEKEPKKKKSPQQKKKEGTGVWGKSLFFFRHLKRQKRRG